MSRGYGCFTVPPQVAAHRTAPIASQAKMVPKKNTKPSPKKNIKPSRPKAPTLKQKQANANKIIKGGDLQWKSVDIPDTWGDYSGFFGLEELDGVDVKMVNGKAEFVSRDEDAGEEAKLLKDKKEKAKERAKEKKDTKDTKDTKDKKDKAKDPKNKTADKEPLAATENTAKDQDCTAEKTSGKNAKSAKSAKKRKADDAPTFSAAILDALQTLDVALPLWEKMDLLAFTLQGLAQLGFSAPTPIQQEAIPLALNGNDVIGKATTGSGKTLAYGIPILEKHLARLAAENHTGEKSSTVAAPAGLIFAPTRELAHQVTDHLNAVSKFAPMGPHGVVSITGGLSIQKQQRLLEYGPAIIVATPGRFLELCENSDDVATRMALTLVIVLDEADRLLQDGHFEEFEQILQLLEKRRNIAPRRWQTLVFLATFSRDLFGKLNKNSQKRLARNDEIRELLAAKLKFRDLQPALCDANPAEIVAGQVSEAIVECGAAERDLYLYYFLTMYPGSTLVFANAVESVRRLVPMLESLGVPAFSLHSLMDQKRRLKAVERFKAAAASGEPNSSCVLLASDVAARGLDIPNIDHVAHYHLPRTADVYVHRSGRTGRAGKEGLSVMFCSPQEASGPLKKLRRVLLQNAEKKKMLQDVKLLPIDYDIVAQVRERVKIAAVLADAQLVSTASRKENLWLKQAAEDLGYDDLAEIDDFEDDVIRKQRTRNEAKAVSKDEQAALRARLRELLAKPLRKNHRRLYITSGLENLAHQMATGKTLEGILGRVSVKALDELRGKKKARKS